MKKLLLSICLLSLTLGCKKNNTSPTVRDILTKHTWYFQTSYLNGNVDSAATACEKNCYITFTGTGESMANGGSGVVHRENASCSPYPPFNLKYYFQASDISTSIWSGITMSNFFYANDTNVFEDYYVITLNDSVFDIKSHYYGSDVFEYKFVANR